MNNSSKIKIEPLPAVVKVRPLLMFTGFLGAGKTTLLRDMLDQLASREILSDVILNDRENAYLDKSTLKDHAAEVKALTGSCVCCEGFHDLVDMILKASKSQHDVLLIELNGTADPVPLQESFTLLESKFCLRPRWQVCVIDARSFGKRKQFNDLESLQLETASHYYISWFSELSEEGKTEIEKGIQAINSKATRTSATQLADALSEVIRNSSGHTLASKKPTPQLHSPLAFNPTQNTQQTTDERHRLAHAFTGCQIIIPEPVEESRVKAWLERLPSSVIRAKALVSLCCDADKDRRHLYERVGNNVSPEPISARAYTKAPRSGIFIGADLDPIELLNLTQEHLHPKCHFPDANHSQ